jgi:hypothetical protein
MTSVRFASIVLAFVLGLPGCAGLGGGSEPSAPVTGTVSEQLVTVTATVEKVDQKKRLVTLRGADGKVNTIKVGEEVRNLPQVKVGDVVAIAYYESLAYEVKKPGTAELGVTSTTEGGRAKPGEKPAAVGAREVTITTRITAIDKKTPAVTLQGPEGDLVTVKVRHPEKLEQVEVGDLVEITYTEAVAVKVDTVPKAK